MTPHERSGTRRWLSVIAEFGERIEHQAATIDVLKVMSASPGDPQPVFDLITTPGTRTVRVRRVDAV